MLERKIAGTLEESGDCRFHGIRNCDRAGDRTRTGDVQLGKLAFYQLNYARDCLPWLGLPPRPTP